MWPPLSLPIFGMFGLSPTVALPYFVAGGTAALGYFGARLTATAQLQRTLLVASRQWVEESQMQHARDIARISELETEITNQRGNLNQALQREASLLSFIARSGLALPDGRVTVD